ncbi:hypothetical protein N7454_011150 [Penicillium verhagenii]|nr:hypothetical protein N7454_011150 [Penicillium verhagenii]
MPVIQDPATEPTRLSCPPLTKREHPKFRSPKLNPHHTPHDPAHPFSNAVIEMSAQNYTQSKAWSSGRVLTSVQRARKQKTDRISKKQHQQRQQDYLETLENRINYLESNLWKALSQHTIIMPV